jgi:propanediol dehydratase large subunit
VGDTVTVPDEGTRPVGRIRFMDLQRVNLDGFAVEDAELGLMALRSPRPAASSRSTAWPRRTSMPSTSTSPGTAWT